MAGLPKSGEGAVHAGARVGGRDAEDAGDLGVVEARVELQGDELALARIEGGQRGAHRGAALGGLGLALGRGVVVGRLRPRAPRCACAGAARRAPRCGRCRRARRAGSPRARIEGALLAEGALEGGGRDLLRRRAVAQQRGGVGVDGVRTGCGRAPRRRRRRSRAPGPWPSSGCAPHRCYGARRGFVTAAPKPAAGRRYRQGVTPLRATLGAIAAAHGRRSGRRRRAPGDPILHSKRLWATVNVCDTVGHPDSIGIRGSMPGSGDKAEVMFMRFQVQVFDARPTRAGTTSPGADSGFVDGRLGPRKARQSGNTFTITPPRPGPRPTCCAAWSPSSGARTARSCGARAGAPRRRHPNTAGLGPRGLHLRPPARSLEAACAPQPMNQS